MLSKFDQRSFNGLSYYFMLLNFLFITKYSSFSMLIYFPNRSYRFFDFHRKTSIRFFNGLIKTKQFFAFSKKKINFSKLDLSTTQSSVLFFKKRYGVLKHSFNPKKYNLHKANHFINYSNSNEKNFSKPMTLLRFKKMKKMFFKSNRKYILPNFSNMRQFKKNPRIFKTFSKTSSNTYNLTLGSFLVRQKIFLTLSDFNKYIKKYGYIFNDRLCKDTNVTLRENDVVRLSFCPLLFYPMLNPKVSFKKYLDKVKPHIFRMMRNKFDNNKQSATHIPK